MKKKVSKKIYMAGLLGEVMEWYDFTVYAFFALIIASQFFPSDNHFVSVTAAFAAFAVGFLMRPLGAIFFGYIGDNFGRKKVLYYSIFMMAIPSLIIGLMPTYATIGVMAPLFLVLMRMFQGLSVGGEHTGSVIYLAELAEHKNRAISAVIPFVGSILGILLGSLVGVLIYSIFDDKTVNDWAWRLPFIFGVVISLVGVMIRKTLPDSHEVSKEKAEKKDIKKILKENMASFVKVFLMNLTLAVGFYTVFIYNPIWMQKFLHVSKDFSLEINSISLFITIIAMFISAYVSNIVGRKPMLIVASAGLTLFSHPLYELMLSDTYHHILLGQGAFAILIGAFIGVIGVVMVELFPSNIRVSAVSIPYNLSFAIFGGTVPMIATWLIHTSGDSMAIAWYISGASLISFITILSIPETFKKEHLD